MGSGYLPINDKEDLEKIRKAHIERSFEKMSKTRKEQFMEKMEEKRYKFAYACSVSIVNEDEMSDYIDDLTEKLILVYEALESNLNALDTCTCIVKEPTYGGGTYGNNAWQLREEATTRLETAIKQIEDGVLGDG